MSQDIPAERLGAETAKMVQAMGFGSFAPAFEKCIELTHDKVSRNFFLSETAKGDGWEPRKEIGDGHPLLVDTAKLFQAATGEGKGSLIDIGDREASTGVDSNEVPYAAAQNFGHIYDDGRVLPAREFEDVSDEAMDQMAELMADQGIELLS